MRTTLLFLTLSCGMCSCVSPGSTITLTPANGQPVSFTTGKDTASTAREAGLAMAAYYLKILTTPNK
jgi:hypothetical protein